MEKKSTIKPHSLAAWFAFMRPKTFWIAAIPVLVGSALSYAMLNKFNFWIFILTLAGAVGIQALSNMQNDYGYNKEKQREEIAQAFPEQQLKDGFLCVPDE